MNAINYLIARYVTSGFTPQGLLDYQRSGGSDPFFPRMPHLGTTTSDVIPETVRRSAGVQNAMNNYAKAHSPIDRSGDFARRGG